MGNPKALHRRALARRGLGRLQEALVDLEQVKKRVPGDTSVLEDIRSVREQLATQGREKEAAVAQARQQAAAAVADASPAPRKATKVAIEESEDEEEQGQGPDRRSTTPAAAGSTPPVTTTPLTAAPAPRAATTSPQGAAGSTPGSASRSSVHQAAQAKAAAAIAVSNIQDKLQAATRNLPKSALEFERAARVFLDAGNEEGLGKYVLSIEPSAYKGIFKESLGAYRGSLHRRFARPC